MSETRQIEEVPIEIKLSPTHRRRISELLTRDDDRFTDAREFVERAIEILLLWEIEPSQAQSKMMEMAPTKKQYKHMKVMMELPQLDDMYPGYPSKLGDEWTDKDDEEVKALKEAVRKQTLDQTQKQDEARKSKDDFEEMQKHKEEILEFIKDKKFDEVSLKEHDEVRFDGWPLLFTHYSRLFPAKIGVMSLALLMTKKDLMKEKDPEFIDLDDFKIKAFDIGEEISKKLIPHELKNKITREHKKSTGLPRLFEGQTKTMKMTQALRERRYKDRVFGKVVKNKESGKEHFEGLMMALGLVRIFKRGKSVKITLSEMGKEFCRYDNPIFMNDYDNSLSEDESKFLLTKCIPQRQLELKIIQNSINIIKATEGPTVTDMTYHLDEACTNAVLDFVKENNEFAKKIKFEIIDRTERIDASNRNWIAIRESQPRSDIEKRELDMMMKQTPIQAIRIATMGRISEMGIVKWIIKAGGKGKSEYIINNKKLAESITKL